MRKRFGTKAHERASSPGIIGGIFDGIERPQGYRKSKRLFYRQGLQVDLLINLKMERSDICKKGTAFHWSYRQTPKHPGLCTRL